MRKETCVTFREKKGKEKIAMLTAYDYPMTVLLEECGIDAVLVGDSVGTAVLGYPDTTAVTMDQMIHHVRAVTRGVNRTLVIADLPFLTCHQGTDYSVACAGRMIQEGGAQAVKIEGAGAMLDDIKAIIEAGIPVMGHLGLTPQAVHRMGGYAIRGRDQAEAEQIKADARELEKTGVFGLILECVPSELAGNIAGELSIPVVGIGAGHLCDGQILVTHDMLGINPGHVPGFVKRYTDTRSYWKDAFSRYINEVKNGSFPEDDR